MKCLIMVWDCLKWFGVVGVVGLVGLVWHDFAWRALVWFGITHKDFS